jgi:hypothetical protein
MENLSAETEESVAQPASNTVASTINLELVDDGSEADRLELLRLHQSDNAHQEDALHHVSNSIENRIKEGRILSDRKDKCKHGEWLAWIKTNAPYDQKTVWNRMDLYRRHIHGKLGNVPNLTDLTDAYLQMAETGAEDKKTRQTRRPKRSLPNSESPLRTSVINALTGMGIPKRKAGELVDAVAGDTEAEVIENALRLHGQALVKPTEPQEPSQTGATDESETTPPETSPEPMAVNVAPDPLLERWEKQCRATDSFATEEEKELFEKTYDHKGRYRPLRLMLVSPDDPNSWLLGICNLLESLNAAPVSEEDRTDVLEEVGDVRTFLKRFTSLPERPQTTSPNKTG